MEDEAEAKRAISALNGKEVLGRAMVVEPSTRVKGRGPNRRSRYERHLVATRVTSSAQCGVGGRCVWRFFFLDVDEPSYLGNIWSIVIGYK